MKSKIILWALFLNLLIINKNIAQEVHEKVKIIYDKTIGGDSDLLPKFKSPNYLSIKDNNLFVVDKGKYRVVKIDMSTGQILTIFGGFGSEIGLFSSQPYGVEIGNNGNVFITDGSSMIREYLPNGKFVRKFGQFIKSKEVFSTDFSVHEAKGIKITPINTFLVVDELTNSIHHIDYDDKTLERIGNPGWSGSSKTGSFNSPQDIAFAKDGSFIVADKDNSRIQIFNPKFRKAIALNVLEKPLAVAIDNLGFIYFSTVLKKIIKIDLKGNVLKVIDKLDNKTLGEITGLIFDKDNNIYIADKGSDQILVANQEGNIIKKYGISVNEPNQFGNINGLKVLPNNYFATTDFVTNEVKIFTKNGDYVKKLNFTNKDGSNFKLTGIIRVDFDDNGNIYLLEVDNHCVQIFNKEGISIYQIGVKGNKNGELSIPKGMFIFKNKIYISDTGNDRIQIFNLKGEFVHSFGTQGEKDGQFNEPRGLYIKDDKIFVADSQNGRIQVFNLDGSFIKSIGKKGYVYDGLLNQPCSVFINETNDLLVADKMNNRIQVFNIGNGKFIGKFGENGIGNIKLSEPYDLIQINDKLIVSDKNNARVQLLTYKKEIKNCEFKIGSPEFYDFVKKNTVYPIEAKVKNIQGNVFLSYLIDPNGEVSDIQLMKGIGFGLDEEAIRIVKLASGCFVGFSTTVKETRPIKFQIEN